jgi:hypothetical protein
MNTADDEPNLNTGQPWSEMVLLDLANCVRLNQPIEEIADFMCRSRREIREKIAELQESGALAGLIEEPRWRPWTNPTSQNPKSRKPTRSGLVKAPKMRASSSGGRKLRCVCWSGIANAPCRCQDLAEMPLENPCQLALRRHPRSATRSGVRRGDHGGVNDRPGSGHNASSELCAPKPYFLTLPAQSGARGIASAASWHVAKGVKKASKAIDFFGNIDDRQGSGVSCAEPGWPW